VRTGISTLTPRIPFTQEPHERGFLLPLLLATGFTVAVGWLGGELTQLGPWYQALKKPWWQPPDWAFPIAWTTIFVLSVLAMAFAWRDITREVQRNAVVVLFGLTGGLNVLWSYLFFHLQRPDWALWEVGVLWFTIFLMVIACLRDSKTGSLLFLPYLIWVSIASYLTYEVVRLNGPFG
jgi:translocator protein